MSKRQSQVQQNDFIDPPVDFNPSLYPTKKRRVESTARSNNNSITTSHINTSNRNMSRRKGRTTLSKSAITAMFNNIADEDDPSIAGLDGICKFAEKINVDPFESSILVLIHKLGSHAKPGQISREVFTTGCERLQIDSFAKFAELVPSLDMGFMVDNEFRDFYKFSFQFNCEGTYKTLSKDTVTELINMVLKGRIAGDRLSTFIKFLNITKDNSYDRITLDQWMSFLDFSKECTDLNDYDEAVSAWPVLIDDYVDFATSMQE